MPNMVINKFSNYMKKSWTDDTLNIDRMVLILLQSRTFFLNI